MTSLAAKFKDVGNSHSLQIEIEYLVDQKIIKGYSNGTFKPNDPITKKHVAAMVVKAANISTTNVKDPGYKDVSKKHPYYKEIAAAYTAGIFNKSSKFNPDAKMTRGGMAHILTKAFKLTGRGEPVRFTDVKKTHTYYSAIQAIATNNISKGILDKKNNLKFEPSKTLTRGHFSAFLARAMTMKKGNYFPNPNYDYYFKYSNGYHTVERNSYNEQYKENYWLEYDLNSNTEPTPSVYGLEGNTWFNGTPNSGNGTFIEYPFSIGVKYNNLNNKNFPGGKQMIKHTSATVTVQGKRYENVVIVEEQFYNYYDTKPKELSFHRIYIAPDYGIIKTETGVVGKKATWWRDLVKRELVVK
ncbi:MAG: S-layer homology domain-containing protein [Lysinibacillus sp.]